MDQGFAQNKGLFKLRPEVLGKVFDFLEYKQLLEFRTVSKKADQITQGILTHRLEKIEKEVKRYENLMQPLKDEVYKELNGELNNEFMTRRMNIINIVNKMDFKSQQFKDAFEKDPVGIEMTKYLKLLFNDNYETLWKLQVQSISEEQFVDLLKIQELEYQINTAPPLCKEMFSVFKDIIELRKMRFMNQWHKQYKIDIDSDKEIEKQIKVQAILARIRQTELEKQFSNIQI
ncbi:unnamed protein product (macronuclear) [Paramecium tetraurelia]|uniref:F-box domain-containing protein n=1 Tax=Paramecium tetraurelia TaxID=5888 RepID=A0DL41_PARTE|nr:uncharacterized protein GSPATT00018075001 [Paramecium tetraurelia]CAK83758.1 unnamed protein product [Paramecium tetraurelia]|eukprot:XP_001451155.1 hypothetical protein (macronuclear) [Paramecium tetraurelia strain d4-2]